MWTHFSLIFTVVSHSLKRDTNSWPTRQMKSWSLHWNKAQWRIRSRRWVLQTSSCKHQQALSCAKIQASADVLGAPLWKTCKHSAPSVPSIHPAEAGEGLKMQCSRRVEWDICFANCVLLLCCVLAAQQRQPWCARRLLLSGSRTHYFFPFAHAAVKIRLTRAEWSEWNSFERVAVAVAVDRRLVLCLFPFIGAQRNESKRRKKNIL